MNRRLDLTAPTAYQGPRTLLKEGPVTKSKSGRKLTMVLCNDIIVLVESRNLYRMVCPRIPSQTSILSTIDIGPHLHSKDMGVDESTTSWWRRSIRSGKERGIE